MQMHEAAQICSLTRKAIQYYEAQGLITPRVLPNGYKDYSEDDLLRLKEVAMLRKCGLGVGVIREVMESPNKTATLAKLKYLADIRTQRLAIVHQCLSELIEHYDVERGFSFLAAHDAACFTIKEKVVFAFPGYYGLFLSLHVGRYLDVTIQTEAQQKAYDEIVRYLDSVDKYMELELKAVFEGMLAVAGEVDVAKVEQQAHDAMASAIEDPGAGLGKTDEEIEEYITLRASDEFRRSEGCKMMERMLRFQQKSGYVEHFIENLKIISPSYRLYKERLDAANARFLERHPRAKDIYQSTSN